MLDQSIKLNTHTLAKFQTYRFFLFHWTIAFVSLRFKKPLSVDAAFDCDVLSVDFVDVHYNEIKIDQ